MKHFPLVIVFITTISALSTTAHAQLNEKKIERDASGIYKGSVGGATVIYTTDGIPSDPFVTGTSTGKLKIPIKDGKLSTTLTDSELPGNEQALISGKEQKSTIQRGGKKIAFQAAGGLDGDNPDGAKWTGGKVSGSFTDKGSKWTSALKAGARKDVPESGVMGDPGHIPAYSVASTGLIVKGSD